MQRYVPYPAFAGKGPVDVSFLFRDEKPAGKHGFLTAKGEEFVFEDGTVARFWGTNFNGGACFPEHDYAKRVARRLAMYGCNIVRFHQLDAQWNTPNLYHLAKGQYTGTSRLLDPECLDRLDYLISCLKEEGIYCYMDLMTYRKFKKEDGVDVPEFLGDSAKPYSIFDRRMIELQKEFAKAFWTHKNPYTGLEHRNDPVFVMCEVTNECDFWVQKLTLEPYVGRFREMYRVWLEKNGLIDDWVGCDLNVRNDTLDKFKVSVIEDYYAEIIGFCRELGVRIPMTGTNWGFVSGTVRANIHMDYLDSHPYFYDWRWGEREKHCANRALTSSRETALHNVACMRQAGKPMYVSEWDMPWPNEYRAESPILYAAIGLLQKWSGFAIHTYAYTTDLDNMKMLGKEVSSASIGGVPYREGIFSAWNDPAKFGLFYHAAIMTRRGDVKPSEDGLYALRGENLSNSNIENAFYAPEKQKLYCTFTKPENGKWVPETEDLVPEAAGEVRSDTGELYRSWKKGYGIIDTPMTQCIYGSLAKNGVLSTENITAACDTDFAVLAMSSLTEKPLGETPNILFTAVGRAKNADSKFEGDLMVDYGHAPIEIEVICADVELKTECSTLSVWSISAEGLYVGQIPSTYRDGKLCFRIGEKYASMYYLIQSE